MNLEDAILNRMHLRGLTGSINKLKYMNKKMLEETKFATAKVLFIGVGHGLDVLLAINDGQIGHATGVDPFIAEDGNDDHDYKVLNEQVRSHNLNERFRIFKMTIQEYLQHQDETYDLIVLNDVLHHMFVTDQALKKTLLFQDCKNLFHKLQEFSKPQTKLLVGDVSRYGLRQALVRRKLLKSSVNYDTKQNWREWDGAIRASGWHRASVTCYVPYALRGMTWTLSGRLGRYTVCDKYFLRYSLSNTNI